ncbi:MAG: M28 family peptidase [Planctomycetes bacterium]|nr:M28 family peptidase [Planctomycetota bacterium]
MLHGTLLSLLLALAPAADTTAALERGLATVDAKEIHADLAFIASDEMRGRDTPSHEQRIAARYIAARVERLGFQPGNEDGWFFQYEVPMVGADAARCRLVAKGARGEATFVLGRDYTFHPRALRESEVAAASLVYGGGCDAEAIAKLDLEDRWLVLPTTEGQSREVQGAVREAKAKGIVYVPGPGLEAAEMQARVETWGAEAVEGRLRGGRAGRGLPSVYLSAGGLAALEELAGVSDPQPGDVWTVALTETRATRDRAEEGLENVCALWPGSDPQLRDEVLIVSAHYDHVGVGDDGQIYNGADDNGSGTTGLMALAEALSEYGPMRRTVMLMWVSGEEKGLLGSDAWTRDPWLPEGMRPVADLNIDMIGRNAPDKLLITPTKERPEYNGLVRMAEVAAPLEGFPALGSCDEYWSRSDHANFSRNLHIPVAFLFSDVHEDYHQPTDDVEKIDCDKIRRVVRVVLRVLDGLQGDTLEL